MPTYAQILALAVALAALIGFGTVTTQSMRHLELKQQRILDGDIDRILAQRREARRDDAAKPPAPGPSQIQPSAQVQPPAQAGARESDGPRTGITALPDRPPPRNIELLRETDRELEARDSEARQSMAQARKSARRVARASRREALMTPRDLGRLPMFTVKTLLGFR